MSAREIHHQAEEAREKDQNFTKSLILSDEATVLYQEEGNTYGMSEVQGTRFNSFKHLYQQTEDKAYLVLAKHAAMAAVEIAEKLSVSELAVQYRDLGKAHLELAESAEATEAFEKALSSLEKTIHETQKSNQEPLRAEILSNLGEAQCVENKKEEGTKNLEAAIEILENAQVSDKYSHDVWLSGAYMRKARALRDKEALQKAKEIIDGNPELVLRKQQWEKLASEIK